MHVALCLKRTTSSLLLIKGVGARVVDKPVLEHLGKLVERRLIIATFSKCYL